MSKFTRRDFIVNSSLFTGAFWLSGLKALPAQNFVNYDLRSSISAAPLIFTNKSLGYRSQIFLNGTTSINPKLITHEKVTYRLNAYNPKGKRIWSTEKILQPWHAEKIELPEDLGHASLVVDIPNLSKKIFDHFRSVVFMNIEGPISGDGHHLVDVRSQSTCSMTIPPYNQDQQILLAMQNPHNFPCKGKATLYDEDGKIILDKNVFWHANETFYYYLGENDGHLPDNSLQIKGVSGASQLVLRIDEFKTIMTSIRISSKKGQILMSHGLSAENVPSWGSKEIETSMPDKSVIGMNSSELLKLNPSWYPGDLIHFQNSSLKTTLAVPNLTNKIIRVTPLLVASNGLTLTKENKLFSKEVQPWGIGLFDLNKDIFPQDLNLNKDYSLICHVGQKQKIASNAKMWSYDQNGTMLVQHLRPQENFKVDAVNATDYWVSLTNKKSNQSHFFIRNCGIKDCTNALLQFAGHEGILEEIKLQTISAGGFTSITKPLKSNFLAARLVSEDSNLSICDYTLKGVFPSARHGINCV